MSSSNTSEDVWKKARDWFNGMDPSSRNNMILTMYNLCLTTRDISHEELANTLNSQWGEKYNKQVECIKQLMIENEVLTKNQESGVTTLVDRMNSLEARLSSSIKSTGDEIVNLSCKLTASSNGKIGEDFIVSMLSKIPNASFTDVTQSKGCGDFLLVIDGIKIMIESKNWTNSSIKSKPAEIENFKKVAVEAKEDHTTAIDFAIMVLHRVTDMKGKPLELEIVSTCKGPLILLYVTNVYNHPDRLFYSIDAGILLLKQQTKQDIDKVTFVQQTNNFIKSIDSLENSIEQRSRCIRDLSNMCKSDLETIKILRSTLTSITSGTPEMSVKDKLLTIYSELVSRYGNKVTKKQLEDGCLNSGIPARSVRDYGGLNKIKQLYLSEVKNEVV